MNYKLLLPSYRTRYLFVRQQLKEIQNLQGKARRLLNLGTGEGDYDPMLSGYAEEMVACDINKDDIEYACELNRSLSNVTYCVEDAEGLSFPDNHFDLVVSTDVIEHVGDSEALVREVARILKPGGIAIITYPNANFPVTYDPINRLMGQGKRLGGFGAYAFNHHKLINESDFESWTEKYGLVQKTKEPLIKGLAAFFEMYWPGLIQKMLKANASNKGNARKGMVLRPSTRTPILVHLTDLLIRTDKLLASGLKRSVGIGNVLQKK